MNDAAEALIRPSNSYMDANLGIPTTVLNEGFIRTIDYMGDEPAIVQAARVSYGKGTKTPSDDRGLIRYLMRHRHTTPLEMVELKVHVKLPIFVARQWIRHRTANVNELSGRYSILPTEFYVPEPEEVQPQSKANRQGRDGAYDSQMQRDIIATLSEGAARQFATYGELVDEDEIDLSRELARIGLPLSTYTEWYWKIDLHNLLHFLSLRADPHAQKEVRVYAEELLNVVRCWLPNVHEAFVDYRLEAHSFSGIEMEILRKAVADSSYVANALLTNAEFHGGLSGRELNEFTAALEISP